MDGSTKLLEIKVINADLKRLKSLKCLCRRAILKCENKASVFEMLATVEKLPLPNTLKRYLTTLSIPEDLHMGDVFMEYNFNFPYHLQHKTHQVYPTACLLDGSNLLLKVHQPLETGITCAMCGCQELRQSEISKMKTKIEKWCLLEHKHLQSCVAKFYEGDRIGYVLEFPLMNLINFSYFLYLKDTPIPEYMAWDIIVTLTEVFLFLERKGVAPWNFGSPDHIIINEKGVIKLENMLLYLPENTPVSNFPTCVQNCFIAPEILLEKEAVPETIAWNIGTIIKELIWPIPSVVLNGNLKYRDLLKPKEQRCAAEFSTLLKGIAQECTYMNPIYRPCLKVLHSIAEYQVISYNGPKLPVLQLLQ